MAGKLIDLDRRVILVAGAGGGGIGTAICTILAEANATVIGVDKTELGCSTAADALKPYGSQHRVLVCDLMDPAAVDTMLAETASAGPIRGAANVVGGM